jgi:hypothetical protein
MLGHVDGATAIDAELAWKAQQHEFLLTVLSRLARAMHHLPPAFIKDVSVDQLPGPLTPSLGRSTP